MVFARIVRPDQSIGGNLRLETAMNHYQAAYEVRIQRVIAYIESHLEEDLSVDRLTQVAGFSKYHFHRQFAAHTGTTVAKLTRQLRLKRATWELAFCPDKKVIEVALSAGFSNPETFARAFRSEQGQSPTEFRKAPVWREWNKVLTGPKAAKEIVVKPEIVDFKETKVAVLEHGGPPGQVMATVSRFIDWRRKSDASPEGETRTFGIIYSDPDNTEPAEFRFDVCGELKNPLESNQAGVIEKKLPAGRHAVIRHEGSLDTIGPVVRAMYGEWLPQSGEELRDFPCFFHYKKRMPYVSEHEQVTDIYLPIK
jgi:AraC family transcriptional regulator